MLFRSVYLRSKTNNAPDVKFDMNDSNYQISEYYPWTTLTGLEVSGTIKNSKIYWTDDPVGGDEDFPFEWVATRQKINGLWEAFTSKGALWSSLPISFQILFYSDSNCT